MKRFVSPWALFAIAAVTMGNNQGCEPKNTPPYTGLRKSVEVLPVRAFPIVLPGGQSLDVSEGFTEILRATLEVGDRYRLHQSTMSPEPYTERPQLLLAAEVLSFELVLRGGIRVGFSAAGPLPGAPVSGGHLRIELVRMNLKLVMLNPYTYTTLFPAQLLQGYPGELSLSVDVPIDGITVGGDLLIRTPVKEVAMEIFRRGMMMLERYVDPLPWEGRIVKNNDGAMTLTGGDDVNMSRNLRFNVFRQTFTEDTQGRLIDIDEDFASSIVITNVKPISSDATITGEPERSARPQDLVREVRNVSASPLSREGL